MNTNLNAYSPKEIIEFIKAEKKSGGFLNKLNELKSSYKYKNPY